MTTPSDVAIAPKTHAEADVIDRLAGLVAAGASAADLAAIERFPDGGDLPARQAALLRHTDRVSREPRDATSEDIDELKAAGFGARAVVTIAQLISFLSFQVRTLAGLRILAEAQNHDHA